MDWKKFGVAFLALSLPGGLVLWLIWKKYNAPFSESGKGEADDMSGRPRGIANNNPGNVRDNGTPWQGLTGRDSKGFCVFRDGGSFGPGFYGLRCAAKTALSYERTHGITTLKAFGDRWAPASDNGGADDYGKNLARQLDVDEDDYFLASKHLPELIKAITRNENGLNNGFSWYTDAQYELAASAALGS